MRGNSHSGFTLIEISIVLVIIGLIVGGVLGGQSLIRAAEIRSSIKQFEEYQTATNTFLLKYRYLPGDLPAQNATQLGFFAETGGTAGTIGHEDGDGIIGDPVSGLSSLGDNVIFFRHLTDARMTRGGFGISGNAVLVPSTGGVTGSLNTPPLVASLLPRFKPSYNTFVFPGNSSSRNAFYIMGVRTISSGGLLLGGGGIDPQAIYEMDTKMDDGKPTTGTITSQGGASCVTGTEYNLSASSNGTFSCTSLVWITK